jgi:hypothetical protein
MTSRQTAHAERAAHEKSVTLESLAHVISARGQKAARTPEIWGDEDLVDAQQRERHPNLQRQFNVI